MSCPLATQLSIITVLPCMSCRDLNNLSFTIVVICMSCHDLTNLSFITVVPCMSCHDFVHLCPAMHVCRAVNQPFHLIFFQNYVVICMSCFQSQDIHSTTYIARHGKKFWKNMARHTARHTSLHGTTYFVTRHDMGYVVPC